MNSLVSPSPTEPTSSPSTITLTERRLFAHCDVRVMETIPEPVSCIASLIAPSNVGVSPGDDRPCSSGTADKDSKIDHQLRKYLRPKLLAARHAGRPQVTFRRGVILLNGEGLLVDDPVPGNAVLIIYPELSDPI